MKTKYVHRAIGHACNFALADTIEEKEEILTEVASEDLAVIEVLLNIATHVHVKSVLGKSDFLKNYLKSCDDAPILPPQSPPIERK